MNDVEIIAKLVRERLPDLAVEQLRVTHPGADDDGVWYFSIAGSSKEIQIESSDGNCPFLVESDDSAQAVETIDGVAATIIRYLRPTAS